MAQMIWKQSKPFQQSRRYYGDMHAILDYDPTQELYEVVFRKEKKIGHFTYRQITMTYEDITDYLLERSMPRISGKKPFPLLMEQVQTIPDIISGVHGIIHKFIFPYIDIHPIYVNMSEEMSTSRLYTYLSTHFTDHLLECLQIIRFWLLHSSPIRSISSSQRQQTITDSPPDWFLE